MHTCEKCYLIDKTSEMLCYDKGTTEYLTCSIPLIAPILPIKLATLSALPSVTDISAIIYQDLGSRK